MSLLTDLQQQFAVDVAVLIHALHTKGIGVTFGDAYRSPEEAERLAAAGLGVEHSMHGKRLAIDLNLFVDGKYTTDPKVYQVAGDIWKELGGTWGGDFHRRDYNHFQSKNSKWLHLSKGTGI